MLPSNLPAYSIDHSGPGAGAEGEPDRVEIYDRTTGHNLTLHIFEPPEHDPKSHRAPGIVFYFGGGWERGGPGHFYELSRYLAARGMVAICADYRTEERHRTPPFASLVDARSAFQWVRTHASRLGIDPGRIAAGGSSAGGHLAAGVTILPGPPGEAVSAPFGPPMAETANVGPDLLVLIQPVIDNGPGGYGHARVAADWRGFSPLHGLPEAESLPPALILSGIEDALIPPETLLEFSRGYEAAGGPCELILYAGKPHGLRTSGPRMGEITRNRIVAFLAENGFLPRDS